MIALMVISAFIARNEHPTYHRKAHLRIRVKLCLGLSAHKIGVALPLPEWRTTPTFANKLTIEESCCESNKTDKRYLV